MMSPRSVSTVLCLVIAGGAARLPAQPAAETRSYDLSAVAGEVRNAPFVLRPRGSLVLGSRRTEDDGAAAGLPPFGDEEPAGAPPKDFSGAEPPPPDPFDASKSTVLDRETIHERVASALASAGMEPPDGEEPISWSGNVLTVKAPPAALAAVEASLAPVLAAASPLVAVDCLLVPVEVLDGLAPGWRSDPGALSREAFGKALLDGRARLLSVTARSGQRAATGSRNVRAMVTDHEVNQTGVIPVLNPVIETPFSGDRLEVRPIVLPGGGSIWLDLVAGRVRTGADRHDLGGDWGEIELPESRETLVSTTLIAAPGAPLVAGVVQDREGLAALVRAEIRTAPRESPGRAAGGTSFAFHDAGILLEASPARRWPSRGVQDRLSPAGPRFQFAEELADHLRRRAGPPDEEAALDVHERYVDFRGPEAMRGRVEAAFREEIAAAARAVSVEIDILAVSRAGLARAREAAEDGLVLPAEWRKALGPEDILAERRCAVTGVAGQVHALRQASVRSYVAGVNQVSGGTGFAIISVADPEIGTCGDGLEIRILAELLPGGRAARVRLEGALARILEERPFTVTFPVVPHMTGTDGSSDAGARPAGSTSATDVRKKLSLTLPRQSIDYWSEEVEAPLEREVILHASAGEGDAASLLVGRVRAPGR